MSEIHAGVAPQSYSCSTGVDRIARGDPAGGRPRPGWRGLMRGGVLLLTAGLLCPAAAQAADSPVWKAPAAATFDWTGWYFGGHWGFGHGKSRATVQDPGPLGTQGKYGGQFGGVQLGYNHVLPSRFLLGFEASMSMPNLRPSDHDAWGIASTRSVIDEPVDYMATIRGRFGYVFGNVMAYGTGGYAWATSHVFQTTLDESLALSRTVVHPGWVAGLGVEYAFATAWTARLEYLYMGFGHARTGLGPGASADSTLDLHEIRAGLNRKFTWPGEPSHGSDGVVPLRDPPAIDWEIHGQTTYLHQGYPAFRALYTGAHSLVPWAQAKETWSTSAYLGVRLWEGGELYYNPELLQGFGLSDTVGAGGFPNGEAQKSGFPYPHYSTSRVYLRQTFGLGGEQETVESDYGQMAGKRDISRVTVQVGKLTAHDVFDNNAYAQDPRSDFMNWSIWAGGAFDYAADKVGLNWGATIELNQADWALRSGYFLAGAESNSNDFDRRVPQRGFYVTELETRFSVLSHPGKLRLNGWIDSYNAGSYRETIDLTLAVPGTDPTDAIIASRRGRIKYGYVVNLEQSLADDLGLFARWSWNNGKTEISAFTDIDSSLSGGLSIKGARWGRPDDVVGLAGAVNGLSGDHRDYLAIGGLGPLIGDGALTYRQEKILEAYYALSIVKGTTLTADYQFISNPAYNADRGPVSVFSGRVHAAF